MKIKDIMNQATDTATEKGFGIRDEDDIPKALCLIHSEVSEALEEYHKPEKALNEIYYTYLGGGVFDTKPEGFAVELADAVIRICHLAGDLDLDLEKAIQEKMAYNTTRPHKHGKKC
jgi:NTP pyrophosphatase (non-canonical NTP hydrolase)